MDPFPGPLGRLRDPLLERDYVRLCARPSTFRNRCLAALLAGTIILLVYGVGSGSGGAPEDLLGRAIHTTFTWAAALFAGGIAFAEGAVAIPTERATNTLVVLLTVPLSPRRLAAGFLLSRLLFAGTAVLALVPIEGLALLLGGVSLGDLLLSLSTVATAAVYGAAMGVLAGNASETHRQALGRGMAFVLFHAALLPGLFGAAAGILSLRHEGRIEEVRWILEALGWCAGAAFFTTPLGPLFEATWGRIGGGLPLSPDWIHLGAAGTAVGLSLLAVRSAAVRLRGETEAGLVAARPRWVPWRRPEAAARPPSSVGRWPLLWKESRPPREWWKRWSVRVVVGLLLVVLAWLFVDPRVRKVMVEDEGVTPYDFIVSLPVWVLALGFLPLAATMVAEEREKQAFDLLRAAPLRPEEYVLARPLGLLLRSWPFLAGMALLTLYGVATGIVHWLTPVCWAAGAVLVLPALALIGFRLGLAAPTVRSANRRAGAVMALLLFGWPFLVAFSCAVFGWRDDGVFLIALDPLCSLVSPMLLLLHLHGQNPGRDELRFLVAGLVGCVIWFGVGALLWRLLPDMVREAFHGKDAA